MNWKTLILSPFFFLVACGNMPFPKDNLYVVDLANNVCAEYTNVSQAEVKYAFSRDLPLVSGSPCDRMKGFDIKGWKNVQNWARDVQKEQK